MLLGSRSSRINMFDQVNKLFPNGFLPPIRRSALSCLLSCRVRIRYCIDFTPFNTLKLWLESERKSVCALKRMHFRCTFFLRSSHGHLRISGR